jgi:hypothetical protein
VRDFHLALRVHSFRGRHASVSVDCRLQFVVSNDVTLNTRWAAYPSLVSLLHAKIGHSDASEKHNDREEHERAVGLVLLAPSDNHFYTGVPKCKIVAVFIAVLLLPAGTSIDQVIVDDLLRAFSTRRPVDIALDATELDCDELQDNISELDDLIIRSIPGQTYESASEVYNSDEPVHEKPDLALQNCDPAGCQTSEAGK